jgi:hypothetical protein
LAEWFIAISLKLILVKSTNIRSNRIFSDENTILLQQPSKAKKKQLLLSKYLNTAMARKIINFILVMYFYILKE